MDYGPYWLGRDYQVTLKNCIVTTKSWSKVEWVEFRFAVFVVITMITLESWRALVVIKNELRMRESNAVPLWVSNISNYESLQVRAIS